MTIFDVLSYLLWGLLGYLLRYIWSHMWKVWGWGKYVSFTVAYIPVAIIQWWVARHFGLEYGFWGVDGHDIAFFVGSLVGFHAFLASRRKYREMLERRLSE